jgi:hypothetical protein
MSNSAVCYRTRTHLPPCSQPLRTNIGAGASSHSWLSAGRPGAGTVVCMDNSFSGRYVLLVGDTHGNGRWLVSAINVAAENGISRILQLGDFGIWPGPDGVWFLDYVSDAAAGAGVRVDFVDGNHEDFDYLDALRDSAERCEDGSVEIRTGVHWWPRGSVAKWHGKHIGFLGGAVSVDRNHRAAHRSWWPTEVLTDDEVDGFITNVRTCVAGGKIDVLATHDSPAEMNIPAAGRWPADAIADSELLRGRISRAIAAVRPDIVVHGHWHVRYGERVEIGGHGVEVRGLSNEDDHAVAVLDLADGRVVGSFVTLDEIRSLAAGRPGRSTRPVRAARHLGRPS